jgi:ribonucleoside-diphosphate reductase beta chain
MSDKHLVQPMFLGEPVEIARYDNVRFPWIDKLTEKQLSFFWRPEEVDLSRDSTDFNERLTEAEKHLFIKNLQYQILLDTVQGSAPNIAFLPYVSLPELETWIATWSFSETIHSRSYTHIIRNIFPNPGVIFDQVVLNENIMSRAATINEEYDRLIGYVNTNTKRELIEDALFRTMVSVNVLEAIRFYVSFACAFSLAERKLMEGNAKIIKLIARDESLHLSGTQRILQHWINGQDNERMQQAAVRNYSFIYSCFGEAVQQEKDWAEYLFSEGTVMGLSSDILKSYVEYISDVRLKALGLTPVYNVVNPLPWMSNWLNSDTLQTAPQEAELSSYLTGQVDSSVDDNEFEGFKL